MSIHNPISPLRAFYVQKVLPAVYDDSLSYYEILAKVQATLNDVVSTTNEQSVIVLEMQQAINDFIHGGYTDTFEEYLDEWFAENSDSFVQKLIDEGIIPEVADIQSDLETAQTNITELFASYESLRNNMVAADTSLRNDMNMADAQLASKKVPYPLVGTTPSYGTSGQVLATNADGTTNWQNPIIPSDAQAEQVITQWLNDHPEATTTVQDGSISTSKLANGAVTDSKLAQSGGVLEEVDNLESAINAVDVNFKELLEDQFVKYEPTNFFPQLSSSNLTSNKYLQNGSEVYSTQYSYTDYIEIEGNTQYCLGLVPVYGDASTPWFQCPVGIEFYDINKEFISDITPTTAFISPYPARYVRVNVDTVSINLTILNLRTMLVKGSSLPQSYTQGGISEYYNLPQIYNDVSELNPLKSTSYIRLVGTNASGIVLIRNGTTIYNTGSHTTYDVSDLVGKTLYITGKSNSAGEDGKAYVLYGFYDANNTLLDYHESTSYTEYTNVSVAVPNNATKLIVNGLELNTFYYPSAYTYLTLPAPSPLSYSLNNDIITIISKYSDSVAIFEFGKRGPNNLPDFRYITVDGRIKYNNSTDWCGPYIVKAVNNGDGDDVNTHTFTGGNHNYDNTGAMNSSATGRNLSLKYYADGKEITNGDIGTASLIEIMWVNRIQAYNTRKSNGTGREVLEEKHLFRFDGYEWLSEIEVTPLEDVYVETYYGFQCAVTYYPTIHMNGADYRLPFIYSSPHSSGNSTPNMYVGVSEYDRLEMEVDRSYDLGKGDFYNGTEGFRTYDGGKGYSYLVMNQNMYKDCSYGARGYYRFLPI